LLFASTYDAGGSRGITFFVHNDQRSSWTPSKIINDDIGGKRGENNSVHAAAVYRDRITALESLLWLLRSRASRQDRLGTGPRARHDDRDTHPLNRRGQRQSLLLRRI
jgi:hypothetical protein